MKGKTCKFMRRLKDIHTRLDQLIDKLGDEDDSSSDSNSSLEGTFMCMHCRGKSYKNPPYGWLVFVVSCVRCPKCYRDLDKI